MPRTLEDPMKIFPRIKESFKVFLPESDDLRRTMTADVRKVAESYRRTVEAFLLGVLISEVRVLVFFPARTGAFPDV